MKRSIIKVLSVISALCLSNLSGALAQNYQYDEVGRLTADLAEGIVDIEWNMNNKITKVTRADTCHTPDLEFAYDVSGNRTMKLVKPRNGK